MRSKTKEAREVLVQAMDQLSLEQPNDEYWYAFGRIAEEFGENQIAETDYKKVKKQGGEQPANVNLHLGTKAAAADAGGAAGVPDHSSNLMSPGPASKRDATFCR
jgi:hypothetical protein